MHTSYIRVTRYKRHSKDNTWRLMVFISFVHIILLMNVSVEFWRYQLNKVRTNLMSQQEATYHTENPYQHLSIWHQVPQLYLSLLPEERE